MVKRKDAPDDKDWMKRWIADYDKDHPIVDTRYCVVEVTPSTSYYLGDGHGGSDRHWTGIQKVRVSEYAKTKEACQKFIDEHEPDEGKTLEIKTEHKRRTVTERWS